MRSWTPYVFLLNAIIQLADGQSTQNWISQGIDIEGRIYNGKNASVGQFFYQAFLKTTSNQSTYDSMCGGTIISEEWILTASHCVYDKTAVSAAVGMIDLIRISEDGQFREADKWIVHPNFTSDSFYDDIGLVHVAEPFQFNSNVNRALLPPSRYAGYKWPYVSVVLSGWGHDSAGEVWSENIDEAFYLKYTETYILPYDECKSIMPSIPPKDICTDRSEVNTGSCQGDSGGPLAVNFNSSIYVLGITSFVMGDCADPHPGGFVNVAEYLSYIESVSGVRGN